jgi:dephospho-CoA kinase
MSTGAPGAPTRRIRVGLTGGIASGKSLVSGLLADLGAVVIDHDRVARQVVAAGTPGLAMVQQRFGDDVITDRGELDRGRLASIIFHDVGARNDLDGIIHPLVRARCAEMEKSSPADAIVVHDIPLLVETGQQGDFDVLVVVDLPEALQLERLVARNQLSRQQARDRIAAQATRAERLAAADVVIDNSGSPADTRAQVSALWKKLKTFPSA